MTRPLTGQTALVTGGTRGLGLGFSRRLAAEGARVAITGRDTVRVERVAAENGLLGIAGDVADPDDVSHWVRTTEDRLGPIDLLVNNAGVADRGCPVWEDDPRDWWRVFEVNVLGAFLCCRQVLAGMRRRRRGRIVNIVSAAAYLPRPLTALVRSSYAPSKAALHRLTEETAASVRGDGVRVFSLGPGAVRTDMTAHYPDDVEWVAQELPAELLMRIATGRLDDLDGRFLPASVDLDRLEATQREIVEADLFSVRARLI